MFPLLRNRWKSNRRPSHEMIARSGVRLNGLLARSVCRTFAVEIPFLLG